MTRLVEKAVVKTESVVAVVNAFLDYDSSGRSVVGRRPAMIGWPTRQ
jgi:hypothetical protein